jgi:hypothetical protein
MQFVLNLVPHRSYAIYPGSPLYKLQSSYNNVNSCRIQFHSSVTQSHFWGNRNLKYSPFEASINFGSESELKRVVQRIVDHHCLSSLFIVVCIAFVSFFFISPEVQPTVSCFDPMYHWYKGNTILLRGKYDVLINVTWDCFNQSNFYISRINIIEWNKTNSSRHFGPNGSLWTGLLPTK